MTEIPLMAKFLFGMGTVALVGAGILFYLTYTGYKELEKNKIKKKKNA